LSDDELVIKSLVIGKGLENLAACGLFRRLQKNIDFLISVIGDSNRKQEQRSYARAALGYLICEEDAIDDRLGIVGYLDDNFIAQMSVDLIEPGREPWLNLLDATVGIWPFLNKLIVDDGSGGCPVSEYMIINSALSCAGLRTDSGVHSISLTVPFTGPVPFLLGFIATLGLIQESGQREVTEELFHPGQKVLVDYNAIAEFTGFEWKCGQKMFGLRQYYTRKGHSEPCVHYWPMSFLCRLMPADSSRATRGQLTYDLSRSDVPLPALEYLLNTSGTAHLSAVQKRVVVVMPVSNAHEMAKRLHLYGYELKDVVPMGHLTRDEIVKPWSTRFGQQEPLLVFASDLDLACVFAEEITGRNQLVIIDAAGRNENKMASLQRLRQFKIPTLVISAESVAGELNLTDDEHVGVWEWSDYDFSALLWSRQTSEDGSGLIARYERRLQMQQSSATQVKAISFPLAEETFEAVRQLGALARQRQEDRLIELDDIVMQAFGAMSRMLRSATPLTEGIPSTKEIQCNIKKMREIRDSSLYLSDAERSAASHAEDLLNKLFKVLKQDNPKANVVREILASQPSLTIICPDTRLLSDLKLSCSEHETRVLANYDVDDDADLSGAIIPGWFRKDRMAKLLSPPITKPLILVLYEIEQKWYSAFRCERQKSREARALHGSRAKLFPTVRGWIKPAPETTHPSDTNHDSSLRELETIQKHVLGIYRQRAYKAARSDGTEAEVSARLVVFEGKAYAFLTDSYKANVVTHLLDDSIADLEDKMDVKHLSVKQLKPGDALLFHRGSGRDVIHTAADQILAPGIRKTSSLWRIALLNYIACEALTPELLWMQLREGGCPLQYQTIRNWLENENIIAPKAYNRDVRVIAMVSGNANLADHMDEVLAAIHEVHSAHLRVSHQLAKQVLDRAVSILKEERKQSALIEIGLNVLVVRIVEIDEKSTLVRTSLTNCLLEADEVWHA
jgi:hypothetical protein